MSDLLYGMHDREGRHILPPGGWCVDTVALWWDNAVPTDYTALRADINWIVRLNWGYGSTGTIPLPDQYPQFAAECANYAAKSSGCQRWIIGNEPNHQQERPNGVYITPADYARCFALCRDAIKRYVPTAQVIPAAVAPYHADPMPWTDYLTEMLRLIAQSGGCDGLAVHTYTRSSNPADIDSGAQMGPPLQNTFSGFLSYLDALEIDCVPPSMFHLPVYITEFNELLPGGWHDANTGVVQAAYADIDDTNQSGVGNLPIMCLCLYRWPKFDQWYIEGKQGVIDDFKAAIGRGYTSPVVGNQTATQTTFIPTVSPGTVAVPDLPARVWDERLTARGVRVETPLLAPGQQFWRVVKARWYSEAEAGGRRHIYVTAPAGTPFRVEWPSGSAPGAANGRGGFDAGNFPMSPSLNEFSVRIDDGRPSETVRGIGMGADGNPGIHTATEVVFELVTMPAVTKPPIDTHLPSIGTGTQPDDRWQRSREFVRRWEGGYTDNPEDHGNWTGGRKGVGELKGTNYGISAASYPNLDIRNLTLAQADDIYFRDYWQASGADKLPWPYCLLAFDSAVLHGVGASRKWQAEAGDNAYAFAAKRLRVYTKLDNWHYYGAGWVSRVADLLEVAGG